MGFWRDAAWADVRQKAKIIKRTNRVEVTDYEPGWMAAFVEGDTDEYFVDIAFRKYTNKMLRWTCNCFVPGSLVTMADGSYKPIESVRPGEEVITHTGSRKQVMNVQASWYSGDLVGIAPMGSNSYIWSTPDHEFYVRFENDSNEARWVESDQLTKNELLYYPQYNQWNRVGSIERKEYEGYVYNLEVEDDKSYLVNNVAVHNCKWGQWAPHRRTYRNRTCSHAYALFLKRQSWQKSGVEYWAEDDE